LNIYNYNLGIHINIYIYIIMNYQDEYNLKFHDLYLLYLQKLQYRRKQRQLEINKQIFERLMQRFPRGMPLNSGVGHEQQQGQDQ